MTREILRLLGWLTQMPCGKLNFNAIEASHNIPKAFGKVAVEDYIIVKSFRNLILVMSHWGVRRIHEVS